MIFVEIIKHLELKITFSVDNLIFEVVKITWYSPVVL